MTEHPRPDERLNEPRGHEADFGDGRLNIAAAAHALGIEGLVVFPCDPHTKQPLVQGGFKTATSDASMIDACWKQWPTAMIGMPTGESEKAAEMALAVTLSIGPERAPTTSELTTLSIDGRRTSRRAS